MKGWRDRKKGGYSEHDRVRRLFRYHVCTRHNPRGRIVRLICQFCPANKQLTPSEFHHVSYTHPFVGVWACKSCHRKIEAGTIKITKATLLDYTPLVRGILRPATSAALRSFHMERDAYLIVKDGTIQMRSKAAPF